jgi:hypothetical protein
MGSAGASQRTVSTDGDDMREEPPEASARSNNQDLYDGSSLSSYAYGSTLNYASNQGGVHERTVGFSNQCAHVGRASNEDVNIRVPYQPYTRNFEQPGVGSSGSSSSQQRMTHGERRAPAEQASGMQSYMLSSQSAMDFTTTANSHPGYPSNTEVPRSNVSAGNRSDSVESTVWYKAQNKLSHHDMVSSEIKTRLHHRPSFKLGNVKPPQRQRSAKRRKRLLLHLCSSLQVLFLIKTGHNTRNRPEPTHRPLP